MPECLTEAELNDRLRTAFTGGRVVISAGVDELGPAWITDIFYGVTSYKYPTDTPHYDHARGAVRVNDRSIVWKIGHACRGEEDRTLTIMLEEES